VRGAAVNWPAVLGSGRRVTLPTYPFQHQRYWPQPQLVRGGDPAALGLGPADHPLLGATVELAGGEGYLLTGRLSARSHPWLADHTVAGTVLVPGTAFVELAVRAAAAAGCGRIEDLTLEAPLLLPADEAVQLQVVVGAPGADQARAVEVYSRTGHEGAEGPWTRHASGLLAPAVPPGADLAAQFAVWPPSGAAPVDITGLYDGLAAGGYGYGPAFRGLRAAWRRGADVFAEVALPADAAAGAGSFGLHPALLDAALHASGLDLGAGPGAAGPGAAGPGAAGPGEAVPGGVRLPFAWAGVSLHTAGASALRVRLRPAPGGLSLAAVDSAGVPVVSVASLVLRPVAAAQLAAADGPRDALFAVQWVPVPAPPAARAAGQWAVAGPDRCRFAAELAGAGVGVRAFPDLSVLTEVIRSGEPVPQTVLACVAAGPEDGTGPAEAARLAVGRVLELVQRWLEEERLGSARLVVVTRGAVAAGPGEGVADLAGAAVWGLVRSVQSENPDRVVLADLPAAGGPAGPGDELGVLAGALGSGEPELAIRGGTALARRLARPDAGLLAPPAEGGPWRLDAVERGTLQGLALVPCPEAAGPLQPGQARVAVRAAGLNFRDVLIGLGM
jgi:candicidin polyketide synthase FscB